MRRAPDDPAERERIQHKRAPPQPAAGDGPPLDDTDRKPTRIIKAVKTGRTRGLTMRQQQPERHARSAGIQDDKPPMKGTTRHGADPPSRRILAAGARKRDLRPLVRDHQRQGDLHAALRCYPHRDK